MIKVLIRPDDRAPIVVLALSRANCERLLSGQPAIVRGETFGLGLDIHLIGAETEDDIVDLLEQASVLSPQDAKRMRAGHALMEAVPATREYPIRIERTTGG